MWGRISTHLKCHCHTCQQQVSRPNQFSGSIRNPGIILECLCLVSLSEVAPRLVLARAGLLFHHLGVSSRLLTLNPSTLIAQADLFFEEKLKTLHECQNRGFLEHEMALVFHVYFRTMPWTEEQITEFHERILSHRLSFLYKRASEKGAVPLDGRLRE